MLIRRVKMLIKKVTNIFLVFVIFVIIVIVSSNQPSESVYKLYDTIAENNDIDTNDDSGWNNFFNGDIVWNNSSKEIFQTLSGGKWAHCGIIADKDLLEEKEDELGKGAIIHGYSHIEPVDGIIFETSVVNFIDNGTAFGRAGILFEHNNLYRARAIEYIKARLGSSGFFSIVAGRRYDEVWHCAKLVVRAYHYASMIVAGCKPTEEGCVDADCFTKECFDNGEWIESPYKIIDDGWIFPLDIGIQPIDIWKSKYLTNRKEFWYCPEKKKQNNSPKGDK